MSVIDDIRCKFHPEHISELGIEFGESESGISKAFKGLLPAVLNGLANTAQQPKISAAIYNASSEPCSPETVAEVSSVVLSENKALVGTIQNYANISEASVTAMLHKVVEACLNAFGKCSAEKNIPPTGITGMLEEQKAFVAGILPPGLTSKTLDLHETAPLETHIITDPQNTAASPQPVMPAEQTVSPPPTPPKKSFWRWLIPLLLMGIAAWFLWNEYANNRSTDAVPQKPVPEEPKKDTLVAKEKDTLLASDSLKTPLPKK